MNKVFPEVIKLVKQRNAIGFKEYKRELTTFNGRDALQDLIEELLDAVVYATQLKMEWKELKKENKRLKKEIKAII